MQFFILDHVLEVKGYRRTKITEVKSLNMRGGMLVIALIVITAICCRAGQGSSVFVIQTKKIGGVLEAKVLNNTQTGEYCEVIVDFGGRVEDLVLMSHNQGKLRKVLLTHQDNVTAITDNSWWKGMVLLPWANRISKGRYTFFNDTYQLDVNENTTDPTHINALHGLLAKKVLNVDKVEATDEMAILSLSYKFEGNEKGYPFQLTVRMQYKLDKEGFAITFYVSNDMNSTPLPLYIGWHPYFACQAYKAVVTLDQSVEWAHVEMNENFNPSGITQIFKGLDGSTPIGGTASDPTFYDDEYKVLKSPNECSRLETKLYDPDNDQTVVLWQDSNFRFIQLFTGSTSLFGEGAVAIEPMSGMADSYNNHDHLSILSGGEVWSGEFGVYVK